MNPFAGVNNLLNAFGNFTPAAMQQNATQTFRQTYRCYPVVMANKSSLEAGDKIILPSSALDQLARLKVMYPMMFALRNKTNNVTTHCGVMEFSSEEGIAYIPYWIMQNLLLESGGMVEITNVSLPKGSFVQFQPHEYSFTQLSNPKVVLETALRNFSCLTQGDTIALQHGDQTFYLDIADVKPARAVSIVETDVNVDFLPPKDMPQELASSSSSLSQPSSSSNSLFPPSSSFEMPSSVPIIPETSPTLGSKNANGKGDYFSKLGAGNRLVSKRSGSKSGTTPQSKPTTPSLSPSPLPSMSHSTSSPSSLSLAANPHVSPTTIIETKGQWDYYYQIDAKGNKRLTKRLPAAPRKLGTSSTTTSK